MQCPRCKNEDPKYFYRDENQIYCRKCIQFGRVNIDDVIQPKTYKCKKHRVKAHLNFELTDAQKKASVQLKENALKGIDSLVYACCGAGKTEICFETITAFLNAGKKIGFAIPRRQVVLEICERLKKAYPRLKVIAVCQGHTDVDDGDLIVCTMHQLYRYHQTFDLLILDEVDAFPYKNNDMLEAIALNACKGVKVMLSATPSRQLLLKAESGQLSIIELFVRPHGHPLIVPRCIILADFFQLIHLLFFMKRHGGQWLVFVPTIAMADAYGKWLSVFMPCSSFTSKTLCKEEILDRFKNHQLTVLFTSTILERGVTFKGVHVAVLQSSHPVFDESSLIQIVGRVGRDPNNPTGHALLYADKKNHAIKRCIYALQKMNESLLDLHECSG